MSKDQLDLLEIGSNNFELIEFSLQRTLKDGSTRKGIYGVNVAKVREVIRMPAINPLSSSTPGIEGVFELRGVPIPAVNLCQVLGDKNPSTHEDQQIIVAEFSKKRAGFIVSQTHRIRRIEWDKVLAPSSEDRSFITGMILLEDGEFQFILDLEKIMTTLEMAAAGHHNQKRNLYATSARAEDDSEHEMPDDNVNATGPSVLIAEDSPIILKNMKRELQKAGFRVHAVANGKAAFDFLNSESPVDAVVTDVEMPQMDGLTLTKKIRDNPALKSLPILIHSSLSGRATKEASIKVGANGYVVKNDMKGLIGRLRELLNVAQSAA